MVARDHSPIKPLVGGYGFSNGIKTKTIMSNILSEKTLGRVADILVDQLHIERAQITSQAAIMADLNADSLDMVEIGMKVEETFNLVIPDSQMEKVITVGDLYEALAYHLEKTGQPV